MATMAVDSRQQMAGIPYDQQMRAYQTPQFTNPWVAATPQNSSHLYASSVPQDHHARQAPMSTATPASMPYQTSALPALSVPSGYAPRPYGAEYPVSSATPASGFQAPTSAPQYEYAQPQQKYEYAQPQQKMSQYTAYQDRRSSHPSVASAIYLDQAAAARQRQSSLIDFNDRMNVASEAERNSFSDALDASRGMVAMSQDITPRNIYGNQATTRSSTDAYGFPTTHSSHSSISSASAYPHYYGSSVSDASSYGDYSSANESVDVPNRTLPRPNGLMGAQLPPAPQSMMGQFSSKVSTSSQKKHKCKICDKRFTRPSSLQTHMYSHTGEKPFACDVEGCGRHFSVVSNLRRHRKVHKGESDHPSPDDD